MRRLFILVCYSALLLLVSACGNIKEDPSDFVDSATEFGKEFIKELYTIDDPSFDFDSIESMIDAQNEFSPYLTEEEFADLANKRLLLMPQEVANKQNRTISVQNIEFKKYDTDSEAINSLDFDLSFTMIFTDLEGKKTDEVEMKGQITIIDTENGLKIDRYYDSKIPVDMINP